MPEPGWYPDPGGRAGHYRYWDGQTWAPTTTTELPGVPPPGPPPPGRRRRTTPWLVAGAAVLVALLVVGVLVVRSTVRGTLDPGPTATTADNGTSPVATPFATASPSPTPPTTSSPRVPRPSDDACPVGDPTARQPYPQDRRVHGGNLSFPRPSGWTYPGEQTSDFTWAYDVGETDVRVQPQWFASYAVGAVSVVDGFEDPRTAARLAMACTLTSTFYRNVRDRTDLVDEATTVDGFRAWTLRSEIRVDDPRTTFEGDTVHITVVDLDSPEALAFFWGCAPLGDDALTAQLDRIVTQLRVD